MAGIHARTNNKGKITSFDIRVYRGRDSSGKQVLSHINFKVSPKWTEKHAFKEAKKFAANYERDIKEGKIVNTREIFEDYCNYVIELKENRGLKHSTIVRYKELTERIYPVIGYMKLTAITPDILNSFYTSLSKDGLNKRTGGKLSNKTIIEHHRLISTVLEQAVKDGKVAYNAAKRAVVPKCERKEVNYFQPETIRDIITALENEPLKWKCLVNVMMRTGARRGEVLGLKWKNVDFDNNQIYICNNILYSADRGIYESTPKTKKSICYVALSQQTMNLLKEYQKEQMQKQFQAGVVYEYVFCQDTGEPMHPDSVGDWLNRFSKRHDLPHLNPHAFRHTIASVLINWGSDVVSVAAQLGHANVSTTTNIYSHVLDGAVKRNAEIIDEAFLKKA